MDAACSRISASELIKSSRIGPGKLCSLYMRFMDAIVGRERVAIRLFVMLSAFRLRAFMVQVIRTERRMRSQLPTVPGP